MIARAAAGVALACALVACGALPDTDDARADVAASDAAAVDRGDAQARVTPTVLTVSRVAWNGPDASVGVAAAVAQSGAVTVVFGSAGVTAIAGAAVRASDRSVTTWRAAAVVPAADTAHEPWIVGVDTAGAVYRLRDGTALENVSDRYGLADVHVRVAAASGALAAFASDTVVALADGTRVDRYDVAFATIAAGGGRVAGVTTPGHVMVEGGMTGAWSTYVQPGASAVALDAHGVLYVAAMHTLFAAAPGARLEAVYQNDGDVIHALAASGARVWFAVGTELGTIDTATGAVAVTQGLGLDATATLTGSSTGDVWTLAQGALERYAPSTAVEGLEPQWQREVGPVFTRNCGACHTGSTGEGHHDLSTYAAWHADRAQIYGRVFLHAPSAMPPTGTVTVADQAVIRAWSAPDAGM